MPYHSLGQRERPLISVESSTDWEQQQPTMWENSAALLMSMGGLITSGANNVREFCGSADVCGRADHKQSVLESRQKANEVSIGRIWWPGQAEALLHPWWPIRSLPSTLHLWVISLAPWLTFLARQGKFKLLWDSISSHSEGMLLLNEWHRMQMWQGERGALTHC